MAQSARRRRPVAPSPKLRDLIRAGPSPAIEGLVFVVLGLGLGLGLGLSPAARHWTFEALGYGWIPVGLWIVAALAALRYHPRSLKFHWRWWIVAAGVATVSIGALSLFSRGDGFYTETTLSGRWGEAVGGTPLGLAVGKLAAISFILPLLLFPRRVGPAYLRLLRYLVLGLQFVPVYLYLGLYHGVYYLDRGLRTLFHVRYRRRWMARVWAPVGRRLPAKLADRLPAPEAAHPAAASVPEPADMTGLWAASEPGVIPSWSPIEEGPQEAALKEKRVGAVNGKGSKWQLPTADQLTPSDPRDLSEAPLLQMARHVETTLADHGVAVEVTDIKSGPRIVRFGLVPGWVSKRGEVIKTEPPEGKFEGSRVKVQSILMREKDLALALKTPFLRIEAPVPGEALVGLEVPAPTPSKVHLREVIETPAFAKIAAKGGLPIALGQDTGGAPVVVDLASLPHALIAGATGSGKSVCINSIVASLLLTKTPDQMRFLMVDPKRVELTPFNGIPHLIAPVIVDADEVNVALRGLMREMLRRYKRMEEAGTRNIAGYNARAEDRMPYLVLIVDELADLMIVGGFEVEQNLVRLAQLGRATGIHLVLATQRPSVNVVTGLLKANIPARAAFAVASQVDSRVILDTIGAEKLLGKGDMLLLHNENPKPRRVQGTLVYDEEIDQLVEHWTSQKGPPLPVINLGEIGEDGEDEDEAEERLLDEARELALRNPHLSNSFLERRLKVGGRRAAQIIEVLVEEGLLAPR
ncbi:MAG: DNA translocase FtsK [Dehalococcoidia bacterium]|nr:DNA translocase FtsK [Dehalococcoidia bacterium]MDP6227084.1 DNA translocase FtsK [Dehalococcoidia bacterium]MDP7084409.1 DNA translocase FtsK [Dehalococcoidia bacterium]MDP7200914.1 DNA translocase FtsK [Dehalococcoidia bacterium]MDP7510146.1 DNA translocase FtsK [Dehalococcoidia bacterium]